MTRHSYGRCKTQWCDCGSNWYWARHYRSSNKTRSIRVVDGNFRYRRTHWIGSNNEWRAGDLRRSGQYCRCCVKAIVVCCTRNNKRNLRRASNDISSGVRHRHRTRGRCLRWGIWRAVGKSSDWGSNEGGRGLSSWCCSTDGE